VLIYVYEGKESDNNKEGGMIMRRNVVLFAVLIVFVLAAVAFATSSEESALVYLTDFGVKDGAVSSMKGVAFGVDPEIKIYDLTHEIPNFNIWEGAYRLMQTAPYWPGGTVFVCVVDPGVGTERKSIVLKTKTNHYFVSPDNGLLTLVAEQMGIEEVREIDEDVNRLPGSEESYTFHGRDVYSYTGARLASGNISFEKVGPPLKQKIVMIDYQRPEIRGDAILGGIPILDIQYGNVWTNIDKKTFERLGVKIEDELMVEIFENDELVYENKIPYVNTFGDVEEGKPLVYLNELLNVSFALNWDNFSETYNVYSGPGWSVRIKKA
jgi:Uncharacterized conserved protein